jgi:hypothetical protein
VRRSYWRWYYDTIRLAAHSAVGMREVNLMPMTLICPHPHPPRVFGGKLSIVPSPTFRQAHARSPPTGSTIRILSADMARTWHGLTS